MSYACHCKKTKNKMVLIGFLASNRSELYSTQLTYCTSTYKSIVSTVLFCFSHQMSWYSPSYFALEIFITVVKIAGCSLCWYQLATSSWWTPMPCFPYFFINIIFDMRKNRLWAFRFFCYFYACVCRFCYHRHWINTIQYK